MASDGFKGSQYGFPCLILPPSLPISSQAKILNDDDEKNNETVSRILAPTIYIGLIYTVCTLIFCYPSSVCHPHHHLQKAAEKMTASLSY